MDTAWVQVFVLILSECVAPSGKTVCQEQEVHYQFLDRQECETVLQDMIASKSNDADVIVNEQRSRCVPTAKERPVFASLEDVNQQLADAAGWGVIPPGEEPQQEQTDESPSAKRMAYLDRLESLPECNAGKENTPCKVGQIIIESTVTEEVEVWTKDEE